MLLKARWVLPVSSPPLENGCIAVVDDTIVFVGSDRDDLLMQAGWEPVVDLGESTLLPGLINAHCHLEFSKIPYRPDTGRTDGLFTDWARGMSSVRPSNEMTEAVRRLLETGATAVADHCSPDRPSFEAPLRRITFWEVLGADKGRAESSLEKAHRRAALEGGFVTPHSFYAVHEGVLNACLSTPQNLRSVHWLESLDEETYFRSGSGPLADYVRERGGRPASHPPHPVPGTLLIHGNYATIEETRLLRTQGVTLVHCPGSHRFFGHKRFPLEEFRRNGIPVVLGTDSLASNEDLSMLREMRLFRQTYPDVGAEEIVRMATLGGAKALRMEKEIGSLEVGKKADLIAVAGSDVLNAERVVFSMIGGKVAVCLNR